MALMKSKTVPEGAVVLDELGAVSYAWDIITKWESLADTWALRYGPGILGGINAVSGVMINRHYRLKLRLGTYGYFASVVPISLMPGLLTALYHRQTVSTSIILMKQECPICYEMRSAAIQLVLGIAYPMVLGPASGLMFANRYSTYRVPDLVEGPKVLFKFLRKLTRPFTGTLAMLAVVQVFASSVITYFEIRNNLAVRHEILEIEKKIMAETGQVS